MSSKQEYTHVEGSMDEFIRDDLVNTAVSFLRNPDVQNRHDENKINFLKKKGLTKAEITAAFDRVKLDSENMNTIVPFDQMSRFYQPIEAYSFWSRLSGFSSSLIVFGVAIYGLQHLYKKFLYPWMHGEDEDCSCSHMKELAMLAETVEKLHATVMKQNDEINKILQIEDCGYAPTPVILEDLKREVNSLKSILISRHQFPAVPQIHTLKATIPSWQMPSSEEELKDLSNEDTKEDILRDSNEDRKEDELRDL